MFEAAKELWKEYLTRSAESWQPDDPRHGLGAEVGERLKQLDIVLDYLNRALEATQPDRESAARTDHWFHEIVPRYRAGEMTDAEYDEWLMWLAGPPRSRAEAASYIRAWDEVRLFTETFYFIAWRLVEVLNGGGPFAFGGLGTVKASGVRTVRNHLVQHPEKHSFNFQQWLMVTSAGPVLKSTTAVIRPEAGRVDPDDESLDRGLYPNAAQLRDELVSRLERLPPHQGSG